MHFLRKKGDYYKFQTEYGSGEPINIAKQEAYNAYKTGMEIAEKSLPCSHSGRLTIALHYSNFCYENYNDQ